MAELDAGHVKGNDIGRQLVGRREDELRGRIEKALDQPGRGYSIHVGPRARRPAPILQRLEVEPSGGARARLDGAGQTALGRLAGPEGLLSPGRLEEVDLAQSIHLAGNPSQ